MTTTVQITSNAARFLTGCPNGTLALDDYVGEFAEDYDMDGLNRAYREAVGAILARYRPTWTIAGDFIFAPVEDAEPLTTDEAEAVDDEISAVDIAELCSRHYIGE